MDLRPIILSIDNNAANQRLLAAVLSPAYDLVAAMSGGQALRKLEELSPDLMLLDIDMPGIDGLQTCRSIRANPRFAQTPIIFLSALVARDDQLRAFSSGGDDFIAKPFDVEILRARVGAHLQRARRYLPLSHLADPHQEEHLVQLRQVNHYLLEVLKVGSLTRLCELTLDSLSRIGLKGALRIHKRPDLTCSSCGPLTDLETSLLSDTLSTEHLHLSARFVLGSPHGAMMIQNMPGGGSTQYAQLQDVLFILFEAFSLKTQQLLARFERGVSQEGPNTDLANLHQLLLHFDRALRALEFQSDKELGAIIEQMKALQSHPGSGLDRSQMAVVETRLRLVKEKLLVQCMDLEGRYLHLVTGSAALAN